MKEIALPEIEQAIKSIAETALRNEKYFSELDAAAGMVDVDALRMLCGVPEIRQLCIRVLNEVIPGVPLPDDFSAGGVDGAQGAVGYTQVMPATARWMDPAVGRAELFRPEVNLRLGFEYLSYLLGYYEGDVRLALTAYNRGPGTVDRLLDRGRDPENGYADKVLGTESRRIRLLRS